MRPTSEGNLRYRLQDEYKKPLEGFREALWVNHHSIAAHASEKAGGWSRQKMDGTRESFS
jgi:hypothetical protein